VEPVVIALAAGAILMIAVERWRKRCDAGVIDAGPSLHEITPLQALFIGLLQSLAMWPGTSRSMMTIVGGYLIGLSPRRSAEFSFLLGLVTLSAASAYTLLKRHAELAAVIAPGPAVAGVFVATITAALAVKWLVGFLSQHGLVLFAWYRVLLALLVLGLLVR
jgi:undecaprenyl-diphosphatase